MGLLTRLREWFGGLLGGSRETDEAADEETAGSEPTEPAGPDDERLDPGAATETRSDAPDDAVDKLRELRQASPPEEEMEEKKGNEETKEREEKEGSADETEPDEPAAGDGKR
ncbi:MULTISPECIES: hypothetical protein [Haloferacaceae]|uniref:Signal recognition particle-docking protein FtsY n=1 Tax=Halorubrum glutamatedens TaxID=2707018 RepID=A0ABD5QP99_9EURY|nr:hypothetical protein [Halobellus captivus]